MYRKNTPDLSGFLGSSADEKLKMLVFLAHLAPSSHNTQPWLFKIGKNDISIFPNFSRQLEKSDPTHRELFLSLGAAAANLELAAQAFGLHGTLTWENNNGAAATFTLENLDGKLLDRSLAEAITLRCNNRYPYREEAPSESLLQRFKNKSEEVNVAIITDSGRRDALATLVGDAIFAAFQDKGFTTELSHWLKPGLSKYNDGMPGYNLGIPWAISLLMPWITRNFNTGKMQKKMNMEVLQATPVFLIFSTRGDTRKDWLLAGREFEHWAVQAQVQGLETALLAAAIEIGDFKNKLRSAAGIPGQPQLFARLGFCDKKPIAAPRLPLHEVLI